MNEHEIAELLLANEALKHILKQKFTDQEAESLDAQNLRSSIDVVKRVCLYLRKEAAKKRV